MKNKLYCGSMEYTVTPEFRRVLDNVMYWAVESKFAQTRGIRDDFRKSQDSFYTALDSLEKMGVPIWVEKGIVAFTESHAPNECTTENFLENSVYTKKPDLNYEH